jgi:ferredoxin-NADP reductase
MTDSIAGTSTSGTSDSDSIVAETSLPPAAESEPPSLEDLAQSKIDESLAETFPASDPPVHAIASRPASGADVTTRTVRLLERFEVARDTLAFRFEKPAGFEPRAGHHIRLGLPGTPGQTRNAAETWRRFSLASAPLEPFLMIATRMRGTAFKDALGLSPIGAEFEIEGPFGDLALHEDVTVPAVLLARGIGITPFRSMLVETAQRYRKHRFFVFYSNRQPADAPFLGELEALERQHPHITLVLTMTQVGERWPGETGHLDPDLIARYVKNISPPVYYLSGPARMVHGLESALMKRGARHDRIRMEVFEGY